jgi:hypothetical protein
MDRSCGRNTTRPVRRASFPGRTGTNGSGTDPGRRDSGSARAVARRSAGQYLCVGSTRRLRKGQEVVFTDLADEEAVSTPAPGVRTTLCRRGQGAESLFVRARDRFHDGHGHRAAPRFCRSVQQILRSPYGSRVRELRAVRGSTWSAGQVWGKRREEAW